MTSTEKIYEVLDRCSNKMKSDRRYFIIGSYVGEITKTIDKYQIKGKEIKPFTPYMDQSMIYHGLRFNKNDRILYFGVTTPEKNKVLQSLLDMARASGTTKITVKYIS